MTCSYVYYLQSLRPMIRLIYDAHSFQHATAARAHDARPHCRLMSLVSRTLRIPAQTLYCQKLESLSYMMAAIVLVYLYLLLRSCFRKPRKDVQDER